MKVDGSAFKCGWCVKFHTPKCPAESVDSIKEEAYFQEEDSEPFDDECFELDNEKLKALGDVVEFFVDVVMQNFTLKHFVKGDSSLGLFMWENGRYLPCEEKVKAYIEELGLKAGLREKVKTHVVNEVVEKLKRRTYFELGEEPLKIAFKNYALDWEAFLSGDLERSLIPIEKTREMPIFHHIPFNLNVELLKKCLESFSVDDGIVRVAEEVAPEVVSVFKSWVGEGWVLLFEIVGFCLYPDYAFHKAFMHVGDGNNGKSTFLKLVQRILGDENVASVSLQDICSNRFAQAALYHKLANIYADIPSKPLAYTGYFKILTGEDLISADRKFKERITFRNYAKLLFSANELPEVTDMTDAFWRRWIIIEFPNKFEDNPKFFEETFTVNVVEKIIVLSILAFAVVWLNRGFSIKAETEDFKEAWLRRVSSVYHYVKSGLEEGFLVLDRDASTPSEDLWEDYQQWCDENDIDPETKTTFTRELERWFRIQKKRKRERGKRVLAYFGVRLQQPEATLTQENIEVVFNGLIEASKGRGTATTEEVWMQIKDEGLTQEQVKAILQTLQRDGKVYSPYPDFWKLT